MNEQERQDQLEGILGLGQDSLRKSYYPRLLEEQRKFAAVFHHSVALLALLDPEGRMEEVNEAALVRSGVRRGDVIGRFFADTPWWDHDADLQERLRGAIDRGRDGHTESFIATHRDSEGNLYYIDFDLVPLLDNNGRVERLLAEGRDITRLVLAEAEVRRVNENLEELVESRTRSLKEAYDQLIDSEKNSGLAEIAAGVAHELKTPLGIAVTAFSALKDRLDEKAQDEAVTDLAELVRTNLRRAASMTSSFQGLSRDQVSNDHRRFELDRLLNEVVHIMGGGLSAESVTYSLSCPPNLIMDSFPGALTSVLTNLIRNSRVHAFPDGKGRVGITAFGNGDRVRLEYTDDGVGMSEDIRRNAFDPFFTTRREQGSTGMGMGIVHRQVTEVLGGGLELWSRPGQGIRLTMDLPRDVGAGA